MEPVLLAPGAGETITARAERDVTIKGAHPLVDVTESRYEDGERGPDPHVHHRHTDAFYVLEGELVFGVGADVEPVVAPPGTFVLVPHGVVHTFWNESGRAARFLNVHAPSEGFADYLRAARDGREEGVEWDSDDPPADGGRPASEVVVRHNGEGDTLDLGPGRARLLAGAGDGDGTFSLVEVTLPDELPGPVAHRHAGLVDSFYVLEGTVTVRVGDGLHDAGPGSYAFVPPGNVHTFPNHSGAPARVLNLMAPGGFEQYLEEVAREAAAAGGPPTPDAMARVASRYDFHPA